MTRPFLRRIAGFTLVLMLISSPLLAGKDTRLKNMTVTNNRDTLLLYVEVENAFGDQILSALNSGVTLSFSFPVIVRRARSFWLDKKISQIELTHTIKFDTLKKDYIITRSWKSSEPQTVKSLEEAILLMTRIEGIPLLPLDRLEKGERYRIAAKGRLKKISRPSYLKYVLFFRNSWKFETKWTFVDLIY
ncbi:MAG: DUF4390 domain-containing protein [Proteobacteria bacterium]|nr:DUF4390 domain-containing protein [Pseudomonadota bacterium]